MQSLKKKKIRISKIYKNTPLGKIAEPIDVANACLFLVTENSSHINGAVIDINGGII